MRMWMVDPSLMCDKHLLGEHVELHMCVGSMKRGIRLDGYIQNDLLELSSLIFRHQVLVEEMGRRGFRHRSDLDPDLEGFMMKHYSVAFTHKIDRIASQKELFSRCERCRKRISMINEERTRNKEIQKERLT